MRSVSALLLLLAAAPRLVVRHGGSPLTSTFFARADDGAWLDEDAADEYDGEDEVEYPGGSPPPPPPQAEAPSADGGGGAERDDSDPFAEEAPPPTLPPPPREPFVIARFDAANNTHVPVRSHSREETELLNRDYDLAFRSAAIEVGR